jgi:hypothetical protein
MLIKNAAHQNVNDGEHNNGDIAAPVGVCQEGTEQGEDVASAGPVSHLGEEKARRYKRVWEQAPLRHTGSVMLGDTA